MRKIFYIILGISIILNILFLTKFNKKTTEVTFEVDTIIRKDTNIITKPQAIKVEQYEPIIILQKDGTDTNIVDTMAYEVKTYANSQYKAVVSGYRPSLDSLYIYKQDTLIEHTKTLKEKDNRRWGVGVFGGYDVFNRRPTFGVGISYSLFRF